MNSIIITGATSFIGVHVIHECIKKNIEVYAVVRPESKNLDRMPKNNSVHIIECEMDDYDNLSNKIASADAFIHLAWEGARVPHRDNEEMQQKNYECAVKAMNSAVQIGCKVFLGSGSQAEYGKMEGDVDEFAPCNPTTEYGRKKLMACIELEKMSKEAGIRFVWTRIFSIYGKFDYPGTLIMLAAEKMKNNVPIDMTECIQLWDFLHVEDAARAMLILVENEGASGIYNVASGIKKPLREYILEMKKVLKSKSPLNFGAVPYGNGGPVNLRPDIGKLQKIGWKPRINFNEGIGKLQ